MTQTQSLISPLQTILNYTNTKKRERENQNTFGGTLQSKASGPGLENCRRARLETLYKAITDTHPSTQTAHHTKTKSKIMRTITQKPKLSSHLSIIYVYKSTKAQAVSYEFNKFITSSMKSKNLQSTLNPLDHLLSQISILQLIGTSSRVVLLF